MIAKLTGVVDSTGTDWVVLDVNGVGYLATCSARTLARMVTGERAALVVETFVRDERIVLFGFADAGERDWFRLLRADGVGPQRARRVINELKDKVGNLTLGAPTAAPAGKGAAPAPAGVNPALADAVSALVNLGYGRSEAFAAVMAASKGLGDTAPVGDLIRLGLKELSQ